MSKKIELGVTETAQRIHQRLQRYLEAQYHIRDTALIKERRLLLEEPGGISQRPFIEVTPSYAIHGEFSSLSVPSPVKDLLAELSAWKPGIGVFPPYRHQAEALETFFNKGEASDDLVVATGTGSGKTETFLYAILGMLALEGSSRPTSFAMPGVRALLLYPMNALVSDQTARLRRLLGDERLARLMKERWGRQARFGMYTSRTPYPGVRNGDKDKRHLGALFSYYERLESSSKSEDRELVNELKKRGRWPAKDIIRFYAKDLEETAKYKSGKKQGQDRTIHHWDRRFLTQPDDRELITRHEMQGNSPDLLITNYSMLEYMLLRPIERSLFQQTRAWLRSDPKNQFLLVLDEAHMYRGVGGAEVGLLIRRLLSRLGIGRERLRCILTSASFGTGPTAQAAVEDFARGLTGETKAKGIAVVRGTREQRRGARPGTSTEAKALSQIVPQVLAAATLVPAEANSQLSVLLAALGLPALPSSLEKDELAVRQHICRVLTGFGPLELLIEKASGNAVAFDQLAAALFPDCDSAEAEKATDGLLALGTFSRRLETGREEQPLLPTRVHLMFRGLPPLYACINPACEQRRDTAQVTLLGRLYTEPRTQCGCGARVFELFTHRDCGASYLRAFANSSHPEFLWHERGGKLTESPLHELHLLIEEPHPTQGAEVTPVVVDIQTGRVLTSQRSATPNTRICYLATNPAALRNTTTYATCPVCTRRTQTGGTLKIMDLATKGEQPFANLVREQFVSQFATRSSSQQHPNEGRKALLFSDGRQKAARLARDLPREVERDSIREAIVLACKELASLPTPVFPAPLDETIYGAFVAVCARFHLHFFDGHDQSTLLEEITRFGRDYDLDLDLARANGWRPQPPTRFRTALLRQIGDPYYSLVAACAAVVEAAAPKLRLLQKRLQGLRTPGELEEITNAWLREMLAKNAFDTNLSKDSRLDEFAFFQAIRGADGLKTFFEQIGVRCGLGTDDLSRLRDALFEIFTRESATADDSGRLITNEAITLRLAIDDTWLQCAACGSLQLKPFLGACENCGDKRLEPRPPDHPYMVARKGFFREPLRGVLRGERPVHITAEEHTAQLSHRDAGVVYATTEEFELRFQDVPLGPDKPPVDILSCTTTMEVGIDIGSLTAVGLRTVPPQRENYQQRAGRAGRRGTSVSSVLMFAQGGAHDAHYFSNPEAIISGAPREPRIKSDNQRLARRHVNSYLLQTFFHSQLDSLTADEQRHITAHRPGIMSALGDVDEFFSATGPLSFSAFETWMRTEVLTPKSTIVEEAATWLPSGMVADGSLDERRKLVRGVADALLKGLTRIRDDRALAAAQRSAGSAGGQGQNADEEGQLLDLLFDQGLLPSYAFPTDLCAFVIQEWDKSNHRGGISVAERPQLGKAQALSEYAPGRLLVVNKQTYRVGGIFVEGPPTSSPAGALFARPLNRYVGCPRCSFISIEAGSSPTHTTEGSPCSVCGTPLFVREYLDPPAFTPENARPLREGDREQEITFASSAQLPEIDRKTEFAWHTGPGLNLRHAYGQDVLLVVANKGQDAAGFSVCESCGGAWLDGEEPDSAHTRPFLVPNYILEQEHAAKRCSGEIRRGLFLVHDFRTDLLLLRGTFQAPLDFSPEQPWLYDALATLAEALALGASLHLDIDPGELSGGFRLLPGLGAGESGVAELYLFDTASGGAGYSADAGAELEQVLDATESILRNCPAGCQRSCTKCLRHYGNRFLHPRLDRRLALELLRYFRRGEQPQPSAPLQDEVTLKPLARFLELEGWQPTIHKNGALVGTKGTTNVTVGTYPALLDHQYAEKNHAVTAAAGGRLVLLPNYLIEHDLPSAYKILLGQIPWPRPSRNQASTVVPPTGSAIELPVKDLRRTDEVSKTTVRLITDLKPDSDAFAIRVPGDGLREVGFHPGAWLIVRPFKKGDLGPESWVVVTRQRGRFNPTGAEWTIAHAKTLTREGQEDQVQLTYGSATGREFRPERLAPGEISLHVTVICHATEER